MLIQANLVGVIESLLGGEVQEGLVLAEEHSPLLIQDTAAQVSSQPPEPQASLYLYFDCSAVVQALLAYI